METTKTKRCRNRDTLTTGAALGGIGPLTYLDVNDSARDAWTVFERWKRGKDAYLILWFPTLAPGKRRKDGARGFVAG
jgi:hypothetical protein